MKVFLFALLIVTPMALTVQTSASEKTTVVGLIEDVRVDPGGLIFSAKMDTGADHSSVNAQSIHRFRRRGVRWVRFDLVNADGTTASLERRLVRLVTIKRSEGKKSKRPVVRLTICMGTISREVEVNLVDRSRFNYKMLIGRSFMEDNVLVDPSRKFTIEPQCPQQPTE
ncbi:MAG: RimK/LysX family protein [Desulfomonilaceae bacterium]|nr:RimK/LysX family protein [Desulfomonilaceae bacterium]